MYHICHRFGNEVLPLLEKLQNEISDLLRCTLCCRCPRSPTSYGKPGATIQTTLSCNFAAQEASRSMLQVWRTKPDAHVMAEDTRGQRSIESGLTSAFVIGVGLRTAQTLCGLPVLLSSDGKWAERDRIRLLPSCSGNGRCRVCQMLGRTKWKT